MNIVENDLTKDMARPAIILASVRSGGTFLAHCLSNHPDIFCERGEPLHCRSVWYTYMCPSRVALLRCLLNQTGYRVSMCKLTYQQAFADTVWPYLVELQPRVVHLWRGNYLRQAVSVLLNQQARAGRIQRPQHSFVPFVSEPVHVDADLLVKAMRGLRELDQRAFERLKVFRAVLTLTYSDLVGGEGVVAEAMAQGTADRLCDFLAVARSRLSCALMKVNAQPLLELLSNWDEVRALVAAPEFASYLEGN